MPVTLPQMPDRIARLPRDHRGFPVPWFVQWFRDGKPSAPGSGEPDFRVIDKDKFNKTLKIPYCWVCGGQMGVHRVSVIGPMCAINRTISEPPSHRECAEFSVKACPFLANPRMRRNEKDLPENRKSTAGIPLDRNPQVVCLWEAPECKPFRARAGNDGILFRLGHARRVDWYAQGRSATRDEVLAAIDSGIHLLEELAQKEGPGAVAALADARQRVLPFLPPALCEECGIYPADMPSALCPGCQAYKEHRR